MVIIAASLGLWSCSDDFESVIVQETQDPTADLPKELKEGFSITFQMQLDPMGADLNGLATDFLNPEGLREIENFVDREKVRILFFTCLDDSDQKKDEKNNNKPYETGKHDIFLFESKSRWVSTLTNITSARWQVTAPVFTYGNNDEYDWEYIRKALTTRPFKIALLVNRPDQVNFGDFDSKFGEDVIFTTDRGPAWGPKESDEGKRLYELAEEKGFNEIPDNEWNNFINNPKSENANHPAATINGLHHCQWDPIYSSKNSGNYVYDFIMGNPQDRKKTNGNLEKPGSTETGDWNMMGAVTFWTQKKYENGKVIPDPNNKGKDATFFFLPDKESHPIPMYGCQKFPRIPDSWKPGTPFNVSEFFEGQEGTENFSTSKIYLLRSLVRIDLIIPTSIATKVENVRLKYANVMARTEPLDVATPTNLIWENSTTDCEWHNLCKYGPIIKEDYSKNTELKKVFLQRMGWFYGAWKDWWNFKANESTWQESYLTSGSSDMPHPRIYNPVIQRNQEGQLVDCKINDPGNHHYVAYCGERNINDPSNFTDFSYGKTEFAYLYFEADGYAYAFPLTDFSKNTLSGRYSYKQVVDGGDTNLMANYRQEMATGGENNWNYPLLRNHTYVFTVNKLKGKESDGLNVISVSSEDRYTPPIDYY